MTRPTADGRPPTAEVEAALAYLLEKRPEGWRLDEQVERALIEAERLKWPALPLPHAMIDFLEYWLIIRKPQSRPTSTQGWRQAWRNWCRIEWEKTAGRQGGRGAGAKRTGPGSPAPRHPSTPAGRAATEEEARAAIAGLKDRFGWSGQAEGSGTGTGTGTGTEET
jgi:hypothetical protein